MVAPYGPTMYKDHTMSFSICEVGPRDGLQSFGVVLSVEQRLNFIEELLRAGLKKIEVGALVPAQYVPEMADSDKVFAETVSRFASHKRQDFSLLIPNFKAFDKALELDCRSMAFFTATSESFNQKNIKKSVAESVVLIKEMLLQLEEENSRRSEEEKIISRVYISTVFHCPYEGMREVKDSLLPFAELTALCDEVSLGDTTGKGEVYQLDALHSEVANFKEKIWWHFHDTYQKAESLTRRCFELDYRQFDSSTGGIGGCPFAPGAKGNIATEKLISIVEEFGISVTVDKDILAKAATMILAQK